MFTGRPSRYVPLAETLRGFKKILEGALGNLPEIVFHMASTIDDVIHVAI